MAARDIDDIRKDIDQARNQLAATVDALAERVDPERIIECLKARALAFLRRPLVMISLAILAVLALILVVRKHRR